MKKIILASSSPRRYDILKGAGFDIDVLKIDVEESYPETISPESVALFLAQKKMEEAKKHVAQDATIITADTVVLIDNTIIGKPTDEKDAIAILKKLSGRMHLVISGVCIVSGDKEFSFDDVTKVYFEELSYEEILLYLRTCKPYDKAGAYAIQEWIGMNKIAKIEGDYYNVAGFPMSRVYKILKQL